MSINKITAADIERNSVERLANRPGDRAGLGQGGLSASQLKTFFSALSKLSIDKVNEIIDALGNGKSESDFMSLLYTSLADTQDDERKLSLSKWVEQTEQKLVGVPEVMAEMESVIDGFTEASATAQSIGTEQQPSVVLKNEVGDDGTRTVRFEFSIPRGATGERGATGKDFSIAKTYGSVAEMNAAFATDGLEEGSFVLISTEDVEDEENAKLFVKTPSGYNELSDLSGATGIKGETGYTPEFKFVDGAAYIKRRPDAEYELLGWDVVSLADRVSLGEGSQALTKDSLAIGTNAVAGARGFGVKSFDYANRRLTLELDSPVTGVHAEAAYEVGDKFSILNGTHYAFCGEITAINGAVISFTPTTAHGTNSSRTDPWWVYDPRTILYPIRAIFWVPEKPLVGYDLEYEGEVAFPNAKALGGGCASAKGALVTAPDSAAGGNYAAIFGPEIRVGYGNISAGRENFSTGLHSALFGRWLVNHGDYNILAGRGAAADAPSKILRGNCNALFGYNNRIENGNYNALFGYSNKIESGNNSLIAGSNHLVKAYNVFASGSGHEITHGHMGAVGYMLKSTRSGQLLVGQLNEETKSGCYPDLFVVAYGNSTEKIPKNLFTVNEYGVLQKDTDGVTYKHLKDYVSSVRSSMESALINGKW